MDPTISVEGAADQHCKDHRRPLKVVAWGDLAISQCSDCRQSKVSRDDIPVESFVQIIPRLTVAPKLWVRAYLPFILIVVPNPSDLLSKI